MMLPGGRRMTAYRLLMAVSMLGVVAGCDEWRYRDTDEVLRTIEQRYQTCVGATSESNPGGEPATMRPVVAAGEASSDRAATASTEEVLRAARRYGVRLLPRDGAVPVVAPRSDAVLSPAPGISALCLLPGMGVSAAEACAVGVVAWSLAGDRMTEPQAVEMTLLDIPGVAAWRIIDSSGSSSEHEKDSRADSSPPASLFPAPGDVVFAVVAARGGVELLPAMAGSVLDNDGAPEALAGSLRVAASWPADAVGAAVLDNSGALLGMAMNVVDPIRQQTIGIIVSVRYLAAAAARPPRPPAGEPPRQRPRRHRPEN